MLGGAAWGGFEFYNDYRMMKAKIDRYVAPDLSGINERISVMEEQVVNAVDNTRTIKLDLKRDIQNIETQVDRVEKIVKTTQDSIDDTLREVEIVSRESEKDTRDRMRETEDRIDADMAKLEKKISEQIQEALDNPLAQQ
jgi:predicted  nucleic acid-binding Zn-ribbon protein